MSWFNQTFAVFSIAACNHSLRTALTGFGNNRQQAEGLLLLLGVGVILERRSRHHWKRPYRLMSGNRRPQRESTRDWLQCWSAGRCDLRLFPVCLFVKNVMNIAVTVPFLILGLSPGCIDCCCLQRKYGATAKYVIVVQAAPPCYLRREAGTGALTPSYSAFFNY